MFKFRRVCVRTTAALCLVAAGVGVAVNADEARTTESKRAYTPPAAINLHEAALPLELAVDNQAATSFAVGHTADSGWVRRVGSGNLRTPGVDQETVVVGSGGGNLIYGFDTATGKQHWVTKSPDSGISSIAISNGHAYYTTYSCTIESIQISTGRLIYSKWLAPTVNCAPSVNDKTAVTAYHKKDTNRVSAHDTKTGGLKWSADVGRNSVLTAPVFHGDAVYVSTNDGSLKRLNAKRGTVEWSVATGSVAAPVPTKWGLLVMATTEPTEVPAAPPARAMTPAERRALERETVTDRKSGSFTLAAQKDRRIELVTPTKAAPPAKVSGKFERPKANLDYQGVKPGVGQSSVFMAYAGRISNISPVDGVTLWSVQVSDASAEFTTPVAHQGLVFVATNKGIVCALEEATGALVWCYAVKGQTFRSQPVAQGDQLFITTGKGLLIALPIGSARRVLNGAASNVEGQAAEYRETQMIFERVRDGVRALAKQEAARKAAEAEELEADTNDGPSDNNGRDVGKGEPAERREEDDPPRRQ